MQTVRWTELAAVERQRLLTRPAIRDGGSIAAQAAAIIERVRQEGDVALRDLTARFDHVDLSTLQVADDEFAWAEAALTSEQRQAIGAAAENIATFHRAQQPTDLTVTTAAGVTCERVTRPIPRVGLYVPAGSAPLPSTALMLAVPASLAECPRVVICTPPRADGRADPAVLVAAQTAGVNEVYKVGGAQAIAAMAYGTATVPKVDKIFGPGNAWVTEAKQQVSQDPDGAAIDLPAGPSEVLVIADAGANAEHIAWDLLSQAEHGPDSQVLLLTDSAELAGRVIAALARLAPQSPRAAILERSLAESRIIRVEDLDSAVALSNGYAPEHLIINTADAPARAEQVRHAGSVFIGRWTPESLGDYCSGTNHVLPTYGWARSHGALGVGDFMRRMTFQQASREALERVGPLAETLAAAEGLDAHRMAVRSRLERAGETP